MSTITTMQPSMPTEPASVPSSCAFPADHRIVFRKVSWETYESLSTAQGEGDHVRLAYDGRDLEIMTTGYVHEHLKELVAAIVRAIMTWRAISLISSGEATLKDVDAKRGLQADLSYFFDPEKLRTVREALARESNDLADYPFPDLAVEIDTSPSQIDRPLIYAALKVAEVWRIQWGRKVVIEQLQPDGSYAVVPSSRFLHISANDVHGWLTAEDVGQEDAWNRRLNQWAMGLGPVAGD